MRISVFIDGANFFYLQKNGLGWFIDMRKLLSYIEAKGEIVDAFYYTGKDIHGEEKQESFMTAMTKMGYTIVSKNLKNISQTDGSVKRKVNLDIEIVIDMFNTLDHYDMAVLVSGDGDFERPLQILRSRGKQFMVLSTDGYVAMDLLNVAGKNFVDLKEIRRLIEK